MFYGCVSLNAFLWLLVFLLFVIIHFVKFYLLLSYLRRTLHICSILPRDAYA